MGTTTAIAWTDHTFNPWSQAPLPAVQGYVTWLAERYAVVDDIPEIGVVSEPENVVGMEIPAACVSAVATGESVTSKDVEAPTLVLQTEPFASTIGETPIFEGMAGLATWSPLPCALADEHPRFGAVLLAKPVAWPRLGRFAHLPARFLTHLRTLGHHLFDRTGGV